MTAWNSEKEFIFHDDLVTRRTDLEFVEYAPPSNYLDSEKISRGLKDSHAREISLAAAFLTQTFFLIGAEQSSLTPR
jgi:hypothetical protein